MKSPLLRTAYLMLVLILTVFETNAQEPTFGWATEIANKPFLDVDVFARPGRYVRTDAEGNVYIVGTFQGQKDFDPGPGVFYLTSDSSSVSGFIVKFNSTGKFIWARKISSAVSLAVDSKYNVYTSSFDEITKLDSAGNFMWKKKSLVEIDEKDSLNRNYALTYEITIDNFDNLYVTGSLDGVFDCDPGPSIFKLVPATDDSSNYVISGFIIKLDNDGNFLWAKELTGPQSFCESAAISVDKSSNVYTTGFFAGTTDFDPSANTNTLTSTLGVNRELFVLKLDSFGNFQWVQTNPRGFSQIGRSICTDLSGDIYVTSTSNDNFNSVLKFNSAGYPIWNKQIKGANAYSLSLDNSSNVYLTGNFYNTVDFDPGSGVYNLSTSGVYGEVFILKLDLDGNFICVNQIKKAKIGCSIAVDTMKNVYVAGNFTGTVDFDPSPGVFNITSSRLTDCAFVLKLENPFTVLRPKINLSTSLVQQGQTNSVFGKNFFRNKKVILNFSGVGGNYSDAIMADDQGNFDYTYNIQPNAKNGIVSVQAYDSTTGDYSEPRSFQITSSIQATTYLSISSPRIGSSYQIGQNISVGWTDLLQRKWGSLYYPMDGSTANRKYRYRIEYQIGSSGAWQSVKTVEGSAALNSLINLKEVFQINTANSIYRVRVIDEYIPFVADTTDFFSVSTNSSPLKVEKLWDYSFPHNTSEVQGVAADGVSRIYLKIQKANQLIGPAIQSVGVTLNDGTHTSTSMLGKVKQAIVTDVYSTEANDANAISNNSNNAINNAFWFWYIAPDDFSESDVGTYANIGTRIVKAHITAQFTDGTTANEDVDINIVRPPLVFVHGIASSASAWSDLNYTNGGFEQNFFSSPLFIHKYAVTLLPHAPFNTNAYILLDPYTVSVNNTVDRLNSLPGNIDELRRSGYACNQVDYVCHSMGGCVLRTAMTVFKDKFYGTGNFSGDIYKTYGKGFVHKAITISTPHQGSPVADAVTEFIPELSTAVNLLLTDLYRNFPNTPYVFDFIEPTNPSAFLVTPFESTPAMKDLQVSDAAGGKNLASTNVKNHLIAGDVDILSPQTASVLADMDPYLDLLDKILKTMRDFSTDPVKSYLTGLLALDKTARVFTFIEWYSQQKGFSNFLGDGDLIVPLKSQLAGLPSSNSNVTVFNNTSFLNAFHTSIINRNDVGNRLLELLNSSASSNLFSDVIPATSAGGRMATGTKIKINNRAQVTHNFDSSKIEITSPSANLTLYADSSIGIYFKLKDTVGLAYVDVEFQSQTFTSVKKITNQGIVFQVNPDFIGKQLISTTAVYDKPAGTESYTDTLSVFVRADSILLDFTVSPKVVNPRKGEPYYPDYSATYTTSIANVPNNDSSIKVSVANTSFIQYDSISHAFTALADTGSTFASINYRDKTDTIYFVNAAESICSRLHANITINGDTVICSGDSTKLSGPVGMTTYLWSNGLSSSSINVTDAGSYSLKVVDSLGCTATATAVKVDVAPLPDKPGIIIGKDSICQGTNQSFSINAVNNANSYVWTLPSGWTGNSTTNRIDVVTGTNSGNIIVKAINSCGSGDAQALSVNVKAIPSKPDRINGSDSICFNSSQTYRVNRVSNASSYTWTLPSGWSGNSNVDSIVVLPNSVGGTITVKANGDCGSSDIQSLPIIVKQLPSQPSTIVGSNSICKDSTQSFSIDTIIGAEKYVWELPNGWTGASQNNSILVTAGVNSGIISVKGNNSCGDGQSKTLSVTVNQVPAQPTNISGNSVVTTNQTTAYSIDAVSGANSYKWDLSGGGTFSTRQDSTGVLINWTSIGNYTLSVHAVNNCGNSLSKSINLSVSAATAVNNLDNEFKIKIIPNPTHDEFHLVAEGTNRKNISIEILNAIGQRIKYQQENSSDNKLDKIIDLKSFSSGVYYLRILIGKKEYLRKVIKI